MQYQRIFLSSLVFSFLIAVAGCNGDSTGDPFIGNGGSSGTSGSGGTIGAGGTTGTAGGSGTAGTTGECQIIECAGRVTLCGNCIDDDADGFTDNDDRECLGPCDNTEGPALVAGVGGETGNQCKADCYFDFGNGAGNDDCHWSRSCDPLEPKDGCSYDEGLLGSRDCPDPQSQLCGDVCRPLTPNGCDCFGCCTFPELDGMGPQGGPGYVFIGSESAQAEGTCTFETVTNPGLCRPCTPAGSCLNTCERCEICLGKPTIPQDCFPGAGGSGGMGGSGGGERCPVGKQTCGLLGDASCPPGSFCLTGCCTEIVVQ